MKYLILFCFALALPLCLRGQDPTSAHSAPVRVSIDIPDADIRAALRQLADQFEINVVIPDTIQGRTSIKLRDVTRKQAYKVILGPIGYTLVEEGDIIRVVSEKQPAPRSNVDPPAWLNGPGYITVGVALFLLVMAACHFVLFLGVLRDTRVPAAFAPRLVWAVLVLLGGVLTLSSYWLIHHSKLRAEHPDA